MFFSLHRFFWKSFMEMKSTASSIDSVVWLIACDIPYSNKLFVKFTKSHRMKKRQKKKRHCSTKFAFKFYWNVPMDQQMDYYTKMFNNFYFGSNWMIMWKRVQQSWKIYAVTYARCACRIKFTNRELNIRLKQMLLFQSHIIGISLKINTMLKVYTINLGIQMF